MTHMEVNEEYGHNGPSFSDSKCLIRCFGPYFRKSKLLSLAAGRMIETLTNHAEQSFVLRIFPFSYSVIDSEHVYTCNIFHNTQYVEFVAR